MHANLARVLTTRGVMKVGTVIEAYQNVRGLSCTCSSRVALPFVISRARLVGGVSVIFDAIGPEQKLYQINASEVIKVDGMGLDRLAIAQHLTLDGVELAARCRRGRRKKLRILQHQA